jgi:hypothetical protein
VAAGRRGWVGGRKVLQDHPGMLWEMMDVLAVLIVVLVSGCVHIKLIKFLVLNIFSLLYVSYTSIVNKTEENKNKTKQKHGSGGKVWSWPLEARKLRPLNAIRSFLPPSPFPSTYQLLSPRLACPGGRHRSCSSFWNKQIKPFRKPGDILEGTQT